ncbi:O-antigen ligase family protein [Butyrivibrio sp. MB2005]|uniref:O-antigen ligase family protein n=1 Tax=Butyrivibrio sp. MB2005 TaxID=1280678 RepID=UPI0004030466|nr:O-antigen ligase family protein [Butyrivibrio sp. MB2005]
MNITINKQNAARIYFFMVLMGAPLYFTNGFNNILRDKTYFTWLSIVVAAGLALMLLVKWIIAGAKNKTLVSDFKRIVSELIGSVSGLDIFVMCFGIACILSCLISEYRKEAFSGSMAWGVGGAMLFSLCVLYLIYSRFMKSEFSYFLGMMFGGAFAMIIAILNDLWIDPLHTLEDIDVNWKDHFTSTIGNIDQFSGYLSVIIPMMVIMFVISQNGFKRTLAAIVLFFAYLNMFLTHADSIYIGVGIGYVFIIGFCLRNSKRFLGLLINGIIFGLAGFAAKVIILYRPEIRLDDISPILIKHNVDLIIGGICFAVLLLQMFLELRISKEQEDKILKVLFRIYVAAVLIAFVAIIVVSAMHFDIYFLNRRGLLWSIAINAFLDADTPNQIFGIGPGCVDTIAQNYYFEIQEAYGDFYFLDNIHNDVLEYLVTTGIVGAASYLGIYIYVIYDYLRGVLSKNDISPNKLYAFIGLVGYIAQSIINGPHPLMVAIFFVLLTIYRGESLAQKSYN